MKNYLRVVRPLGACGPPRGAVMNCSQPLIHLRVDSHVNMPYP